MSTPVDTTEQIPRTVAPTAPTGTDGNTADTRDARMTGNVSADGNASNTGSDGDTGPAKRRPRILAAILAVILVAAGAGALAWTHHLDTQAQAAYQTAAAAQAQAVAALTTAVADAQQTLTDSQGKVADEKTRTALRALITQAQALGQPTPVADGASRAELTDAATTANSRAASATSLTEQITRQAQVVKDSMDQKALDDAKANVQQNIVNVQGAIDSARETIDASAGKVSDDQVRQDAEASRTAASDLLAKAQALLNGSDVDSLNDAMNALADANTDLVVKTKAVTDAQTAWQAAQDAAAAAAAASPSSAGASTGVSSAWNGSYAGGSASTPSTGSTSGSGSGAGGGSGDGSYWVVDDDLDGPPVCLGFDTSGNSWEVPCG